MDCGSLRIRALKSMRFSFNTSSQEVRFHCPDILRPIFRKENERERAARAAEQSETTQDPPLLHTQANNRRYHFFRMVSLTPRGDAPGADSTPDMTASTDTRVSVTQQEIPNTPEEQFTEEETAEDEDMVRAEEAVSSLQKSEIPPIRDLTWDAAKAALDTLKANLEEWAPNFDPEGFKSKGTLEKAETALTPEEKDEVRLYHTHNVLDQMISSSTKPADQELFSPSAIFVNDLPVGIMFVCDTDPTYLACVVTHPGQQTAGGSLLEHAVNTSIGWGKDGCIELLLDNPAAKGAYEAMGFSSVNDSDLMTLNPSGNDKWRQVDERWRLKDYVDTRYVTGFGPRPAPGDVS
jgi:hypothetical protein